MFVPTNKKGFTLVELLVAMAISTMVMAAIYSTYHVQLRSHITQQTVVEMQQNARAAMFGPLLRPGRETAARYRY